MKCCPKCKTPKELKEFNNDKNRKDGKYPWCKRCCYLAQIEYRKRNPEKDKEWVKENHGKILKTKKRHYWKNRETILIKNRIYAHKNKEKINLKARNYRKNNEKVRLSQTMSSNIKRSLKRGQKNYRHWESLVGYTLKQLIKHLKKTMPKGHTWQDFLDGKLHIDHKIPIAVFNFTKPGDIDFKRCWALSNLQLLSSKENLIKGAKLNKPFQPCLAF